MHSLCWGYSPIAKCIRISQSINSMVRPQDFLLPISLTRRISFPLISFVQNLKADPREIKLCILGELPSRTYFSITSLLAVHAVLQEQSKVNWSITRIPAHPWCLCHASSAHIDFFFHVCQSNSFTIDGLKCTLLNPFGALWKYLHTVTKDGTNRTSFPTKKCTKVWFCSEEGIVLFTDTLWTSVMVHIKINSFLWPMRSSVLGRHLSFLTSWPQTC